MVSEPLLLPRGNGGVEWLGHEKEDDGWLVTIVHDAVKKQCRMVVFDGTKFSDGPQATLDLGTLLPWNVHGHWIPA